MSADLRARLARARTQATIAEGEFLSVAREASGDPAKMGALGAARAAMDQARQHLVDVEAEAAATPEVLDVDDDNPDPTVADAVVAIAGARRFRPADIGLGHSTAARIKHGIAPDAETLRRLHRLLADYRPVLTDLGFNYDDLAVPAAAAHVADKPTPVGPIGRSTVWVDGTALWLKAPYAARDLVRDQIPAAVWQKSRVAYKLPRTPQAAVSIADALGRYGIDADDLSTELVRTGRRAASAQVKRTATDLPPIPGSKTEAWTHQLQAFWFARELPGALLDMEMGPQPHRTPVLTPTGWRRFGELEPGDLVVGSNGEGTPVVRVKEFARCELVRVHLNDGATVECSIDHPFTVRAAHGRTWKTLTVAQIEESLLHPAPRSRWRLLPSVAPVQHPEADLPLDPFVLGMLLSCGSLPDVATWSTDDAGKTYAWTPPIRFRSLRPAAVAELAVRLPAPATVQRIEGEHGWWVIDDPDNTVYAALDALGLVGISLRSKFVPPAYLLGSVDQREDLIDGLYQGALDDPKDPYQFSCPGRRLAEDAATLARSLGGTGRVRTYPGKAGSGTQHRLTHGIGGRVGRFITSVERTGTFEPMRCIEVAADDHLYVTDGYVLTHNTGKSKVVVDLIHDSRAEASMIVCPERVVGVWPKQFGIHCGGEKHIIDPRRQNSRGEWKLLPIAQRVELYEHALHACDCGLPHVLISNFSAAAHEPFKSWSLRQHFDYIAYDESHRLRSHGGVWSRWAEKMKHRTDRALGGTGTLQAQTPLDVFGQARAVEPGLFGSSYRLFERRYALKGGFEGKQVVGYQREDELAAKLSTITYHAGEEVLDLPEMLPDVRVTGTLSPRAWKAYKALEDEMYAEVRRELSDGTVELDEVTADNVLVRILRCQQLTGGALPLDSGEVEAIDDTKYKLLLDELEDIPSTEPVVVFARFHHDLDNIARAAAKMGRSYGELSGRRQDALAHDATLAEGIAIAGVQIQSGGTGVDFTRSAFGVYYSVGHSLGDYLQSRKRLQRPGQTRRVRFRHLVLEGTIDEDVYEALENRQKVTDRIAAKVLGYQRGGAFH